MSSSLDLEDCSVQPCSPLALSERSDICDGDLASPLGSPLPSLGPLPPTEYLFKAFGLQGFDELRKYIKQGSEFCKEIAIILQERCEAEQSYAKSLSKISAKLTKATSTCIGTMPSAWAAVAMETEAEAEMRRDFASAIQEEICKPLKTVIDNQIKRRRPIENNVEKSVRAFQDRRSEELKSKSKAFSSCRESQKTQLAIDEARAGRGKHMTEKDISKMEKKNKTLLSSLAKSDKDYHEQCQTAESARQEWESTVYKASGQLQLLDEERITQMHSFLQKYHHKLSAITPTLSASCDKLNEAVLCVNVDTDLRMVVEQKGSGLNHSEQFLFECCAEDMSAVMDPDRRKKMLWAYLQLLEEDINREQKGKEGVEKLMDVYRNRPDYTNPEAQEDARQRLMGVNSMLNYLDASHYKLSCVLAKLDNKPSPSYKFSQNIESTKDKQGLPLHILRLPVSVSMEGFTPRSYSYARQPADGGHDRDTMMFDEDEFDDYDGDPVDDQQYMNPSGRMQGQCEAIYDYTAAQDDELSLTTGDIINIYERQDSGWWHGELNGRMGIFPATYVRDLGDSDYSHL